MFIKGESEVKIGTGLALTLDEKVERRRALGRAATQRYREKNRVRLRAEWREWARRNPEKVKAIARRRRRDLVKKREADRLYRLANPETCKAGIARAKAAKPELYRALAVQSVSRRRSRKRLAPVEPVSRRVILQRDRGRCHLCGQAISDQLTFDHLIPVVRGGAHAEWNLMLAHDRCNKRRGIRPLFSPETRDQAERYIAARIAEYAEAVA